MAYLQIENDVKGYKKLLTEKDSELAKFHSFTIKYQADIQFYEK